MQAAGVNLNQEKCEFQKSNLLFLGHIIDEKSIRAHPVKTEAVHKMKSAFQSWDTLGEWWIIWGSFQENWLTFLSP